MYVIINNLVFINSFSI